MTGYTLPYAHDEIPIATILADHSGRFVLRDKNLLLATHPSARGLSQEAIAEISDAAELREYEPGDVLHAPGDVVETICLVVHGRLRQTLFDMQGHVIAERMQKSGGQFGAISAATGEAVRLECVAEDPTVVLAIDYEVAHSLSNKFPLFRSNVSRMIAEGIQQTLFKDTRPKRPRLVTMIHQDESTRHVTERLYRRLGELNDTFACMSDYEQNETLQGVPYLFVKESSKLISQASARTQAVKWLEEGRQVFGDFLATLDRQRIADVVETTDLVLWLITPDNWRTAVQRLQELGVRAGGLGDRVVFVWCLDEYNVPDAPELNSISQRTIKLSFRKPSLQEGNVLNHGFERLVHCVRGVQIGLALGGGGARGMAHLGVLKALEQHGIVVDQLVGTSAGAMTGTVYGASMELDYSIDSFTNDLTPSRVFRMFPHGEHWHMVYKYRTGQFDPMLRKYMDETRVEQLHMPVQSVAVDLISGKLVVRKSGDAVHAILESINLPVISRPINRDGQVLIDGGMIDNVPADILAENGCNFIIAVNVTNHLDENFVGNHADTPTAEMKRASAIQTVLRTYLVQSSNINARGVQHADLVIEPDVSKYELSAFTKARELSEIGMQATLERLPEIKRLLNHLDPHLFSESLEPT